MLLQIYKSIFETKKIPKGFYYGEECRDSEFREFKENRDSKDNKDSRDTKKLGYQKIISTLSAVPAVPIVPIKISPHLCDKFHNLFHILQKSSIFAP